MYVCMCVLLPAFSFKVPVSSWTRPDTPPALETMAPKLVKKVDVKAPSTTSANRSSQKAKGTRMDLRTLTSPKNVTGGQGRKIAKPAAATINVMVWQYNSDCDGWLAAPNAASKLYAVML